MAQVLPESRSLQSLPVSGLPLRLAERRFVLFVGDTLLLLAAGVLALATWAILAPGIAFSPQLLLREGPWLLGLDAAWLILWAANDGYDLRLAARVRQMNRKLLTTALVLGAIYLVVFFVFSVPLYGFQHPFAGLSSVRPLRLLPTLFVAFALPGQLTWRNVYSRVLMGGRFRRRTIVVGAGRSGHTIVEALNEHGDGSYEIIGFVDDDPAKQGRAVAPGVGRREPSGGGDRARASATTLRVLGDRRALKALIGRHDVSTLVLAITHEVHGELLPILLDCLELGVEIVPMPVLYEQLTGRVPVEHVGDSWYVAMPIQHPSTSSLFRVLRRAIDIALTGMGLICLGLAFPFIALAIYLDSPGPIFYSQERVGKGGRIFRAYKFRSMVPGAENGEAMWAQENDNRVTRVGRILRKTHVDEFPQFLNILKGEMSAVGPRPERPEFAGQLAREIPFYRVRHAVKPGMAGWALVRQGYASSKEDALLRLQYDLYYIKHQSLWLDLVILLRTIADTLTFGGR